MRAAARTLALTTLLGGLVVGTGPVQAVGRPEVPCARSDQITSFLKDQFGEEPISLGIGSNGQLFQIFASEATRSWTVVTTTPTGMACVLATGEHWEQMPIGPQA